MQASWTRHEANKDAAVHILFLHLQGLPQTAQHPHQFLSSLLPVLLQCSADALLGNWKITAHMPLMTGQHAMLAGLWSPASPVVQTEFRQADLSQKHRAHLSMCLQAYLWPTCGSTWCLCSLVTWISCNPSIWSSRAVKVALLRSTAAAAASRLAGDLYV